MKYWIRLEVEIFTNDIEHYQCVRVWSLQHWWWDVKYRFRRFVSSFQRCQRCGKLNRKCHCDDGLPF